MESNVSSDELVCELELSLFNNGNYSPEECLAILNKKIAENCLCAYKYRAKFYSLMLMYDEAIRDYKKALEINPKDEEIIIALKDLEQM